MAADISFKVMSQGGWPPRAWMTVSRRASEEALATSVIQAAALSRGAVAASPLLGACSTKRSQAWAKPKARKLCGTPVNMAVRTEASRATPAMVVRSAVMRAPASVRPWAEGGSPVRSEATTAETMGLGARC